MDRHLKRIAATMTAGTLIDDTGIMTPTPKPPTLSYQLEPNAWSSLESYYHETGMTLPHWVINETPIDTPHKMAVVCIVAEYYSLAVEDFLTESVSMELEQ